MRHDAGWRGTNGNPKKDNETVLDARWNVAKKRYAAKLVEELPSKETGEIVESTAPDDDGPWSAALYHVGRKYYVELRLGFPERRPEALHWFGPFRSRAEGSIFLNDLADDLMDDPITKSYERQKLEFEKQEGS